MKNHKQLITASCLFLLLTSISYATDSDDKKTDKISPEHTANEQNTAPKNTQTAAEASATKDFIAQGHLSVMQHEIIYFPCNSLEEYKVEDKTRKNMLSYLYEGFSADATYPIYLEIEDGELSKKEEGQAQLTIKKIKQASSVEKKLDCRSIGFNPNFRAMGAEPFWHLVVLPAGLLLLNEQGEPTRYPYVEPEVTDKTIRYTSKQSDKTLNVSFEPKVCMPSNDHAENATKFAYTAEIKIGDNTFKGCAIKGKDKEAEPVKKAEAKS